MKTTLLSLLFLFFGCQVFGQTIHDITWTKGMEDAEASIEIQAGDTVRWIWGDSDPHNIMSEDDDLGDFGSETISQEGYVYSYTFNDVGTIDYFCNLDPATMSGSVKVVRNNNNSDLQDLDFKIYPNPVKDRIYFENEAQSNVEVTIYDVLGKVVKHEKLSNTTIRNGMDVSSFKRGIYLVQVDNGNNTFTQKLIKN